MVVDDLLSPDALGELQQYARHGCHFRTMRAGYLGAFPADGVTHPRLLSLVEELGIAAPRIVAGHTLGLWWLFKYRLVANHSPYPSPNPNPDPNPEPNPNANRDPNANPNPNPNPDPNP